MHATADAEQISTMSTIDKVRQSDVTIHTQATTLSHRRAAAGGSILREVLEPAQRTKLNTGDDRAFYASPRIVYHVDDAFVTQLTQLYRERIPENATVLDLMSSWVSHLPPEATYARVVGHGLNAAEVAVKECICGVSIHTVQHSWRATSS